MRTIISELTDCAGGAGNIIATQRYLIERTAVDILRLEMLDVKMASGDIPKHDAIAAHALRGSVRLALRDLGLRPAAAAPPPMDALEYIRQHDARRGGKAA